VLNARDLALQRRGYYEELDVGQMDNWQWRHRQEMETPDGWNEGRKVFSRDRADFLSYEIVPSVSTTLGGAPITSNRLGMRDREYSEIKPLSTYRIVLVGTSHDEGIGVKDNETYENLVEDRLNNEPPDQRYPRYEILNMSVAGWDVLQRLLWLEQRGFQFAPDAAMFSVGAQDQEFLVLHLRKVLTLAVEPPSDYREICEGIFRKARVHGKMPAEMIERRLQPYVAEAQEWAFHRFATECRRRGIRPIVIYRPGPVDFKGIESTR
jgi:hypothetical protein